METALMELQHINVKLLLQEPEHLDLELLVPVFHNWIRDQVCDEHLHDVADYRHVFAGPGVILIGLEADYSLDHADNRLGLRYNRKAVLNGDTNQARLIQAVRSVLAACQRLESDPSLGGKLRFNEQDIEIFINDRLLAPNCEETREALRPELQSFCEKLFGKTEFVLSFNTDPRRLLTAYVRASQPVPAARLLDNLMA